VVSANFAHGHDSLRSEENDRLCREQRATIDVLPGSSAATLDRHALCDSTRISATRRLNSMASEKSPPATRTSPTASAKDETVIRFHGVRYQTKDVSRSAAFYTQHLGFNVTHDASPAFASLSLGPLDLLISGPKASGSRPMPSGTTQEPGGWNRIVLRVQD